MPTSHLVNCIVIAMAFVVSFQIEHMEAQDIVITVKPDDEKPEVAAPFNGVRPAADMAILLDTSNSMDGLISQAKSQLWTIVQQFAQAKKAGKTPALRVSVSVGLVAPVKSL